MNVNPSSATGFVFARRAHVIFNIAAAEHAARVDIFESRKDLLRTALRNLNNHIQPSAMAHAHYELHCPALARRLDDLVYQRDQGCDSFQ